MECASTIHPPVLLTVWAPGLNQKNLFHDARHLSRIVWKARFRNRCIPPRLQPVQLNSMRCVTQKGSGTWPGREKASSRERRAQGMPGLSRAFEDQLAGSGGDRAGGADRADRASVAQDVANRSPLGRRQLRLPPVRSSRRVRRSGTTGAAVGSRVQGGERFGEIRCSLATASCGERAKVRRNLDPGMRGWPSIASSVNPARRRLSRRASSAVSKWVRT